MLEDIINYSDYSVKIASPLNKLKHVSVVNFSWAL